MLSNGGSDGGFNGPSAKRTFSEADLPLEILYIGSRLPLDRQLVEGSGLPLRFYGIFTGKLRRYFSWQNFIDPFFLALGFFQSLWIMLTFRPHLVFSKGGYVSLPVAFAAFLFRVPVILHESDSTMGLSNRLVSKIARRICISFPGVAKGKKVVFTGNPVRLSLQDGQRAEGYRLTGFNPKKPVVLIWGGSLGAQQINDLILSEIDRLTAHFQVIHITGRGKKAPVKHKNYYAREYADQELKHLYAITDLVAGRAGANSLYELALMKKPNICLPLAINQDQQKNALYFQKNGAAIVWKEGEKLSDLLLDLWKDKAKYQSMQKALETLSTPRAAKDIADLIRKYL